MLAVAVCAVEAVPVELSVDGLGVAGGAAATVAVYVAVAVWP